MNKSRDFSRGNYRRIYAMGVTRGRRINAVSIEAEACFWRLVAIADDYGNLNADPVLLKADAFPLRSVSAKKLQSWIRELENTTDSRGNPCPLVSTYAARGETYLHIEDFEELQPAGKNGVRYQRFPPNTPQTEEPECVRVNPSESKIIQNDPDYSVGLQEQEQKQEQRTPPPPPPTPAKARRRTEPDVSPEPAPAAAAAPPGGGGGGNQPARTAEQERAYAALRAKPLAVRASNADRLARQHEPAVVVWACKRVAEEKRGGGAVVEYLDSGDAAIEHAESVQRQKRGYFWTWWQSAPAAMKAQWAAAYGEATGQPQPDGSGQPAIEFIDWVLAESERKTVERRTAK